MRFTLILLFIANISLAQNPSKFVNPFIGTGGHGHTFPGATTPFGMVQLSPDTRVDGSWDGCSGYHYSDSIIYGFSHTHLSGTGVSDYGDIMVMPTIGELKLEQDDYKSTFSHEREEAGAGYYNVFLDKPQIAVELTTSSRVGFHRYIYSEEKANVILDLTHRDELLDFEITEETDKIISGYRRSKAWAKDQHVFFVMEFSAPIYEKRYSLKKDKLGMTFDLDENKELMIKVGISFVSVEGARANLKEEIPHWNFEGIRKEASRNWDQELSKIEVFTKDKDKENIFYTALYHCMIHPNVAEDVDGKFRGHDNKIHVSPNHTQYTVFSLWDTYRALHPLMTIIDEKRTTDFINSFLEIYKQSGRLPVWELCNNETDCMIGYHSVSVIADAYLKGIRGFDTTLALEAMVASANEDIFGLPSYRKYGFIRAEDESESVSKTLEYAYDDWCISLMAEVMGEDSLANVFKLRSESWRNIINPETGFVTPRINGDWIADFDPRQVNFHFTEANSWQYSFVQHSNGGSDYDERLEKKLDAFFTAPAATTGRTQSDITGMIGQYAHGNEPSHHIAYLYNNTDSYNKTRKLIDQICDSFYTNAPEGLIGNEDCGQMSAWYVLSASGFYPSTPGYPQYAVGSCQFDSVIFKLDRGKEFKIKSVSSIYDNKEMNLFISQDRILNGGSIITGEWFQLYKGLSATTPSRTFCGTPLIRAQPMFEESTEVMLIRNDFNAGFGYSVNLFYSVDTSKGYQLSNGDIVLDKSNTVFAYAKCIDSNCLDGKNYCYSISPTISATFYKKPNNWTCIPNILPNSQYNGGGVDALIDGIHGTVNWQAGRWQGYQNQEVTFNLDFKEPQEVREVITSFLQDSRSWILMPSKIEVYHAGDLIGTKSYSPDAFLEGAFLENITVNLDKRIKTDKLQVKIYSAGKLPEGHPGFTMDGDAFFFVDEIAFSK
ncbi:MAG: alpha-mannosidase [Bacteroidetes bacterium]|nr:MAG: alpha-mannosidase [Bacteroidota bacterium]